MKNPYYLIWSNTILNFQKYNPKTSNWKLITFSYITWMQALNLGVITIWLKYFKVYTLPFVDIDFSLGDDIDGIALKNYYDPNYKGDFVVSPLKAIANQSVGLYSLLGGTAGAIVGVFYFGIEAFYLGG